MRHAFEDALEMDLGTSEGVVMTGIGDDDVAVLQRGDVGSLDL